MSKREISEIYRQLDDRQKKSVVQRINTAMQTSISPQELQSFVQHGRLFKKDVDKIYGIVSDYSKKKQLRSIVQGKPRRKEISSLVTSFLRPSQIGKMTRASVGSYRTFYENTAPTLQKIDSSKMRNPKQFIKKLSLFSSLKELDLIGVHLDANTSRDLAKAIPKLTNLESINLHGSQLDVENALLVLPAISHLKALKVLDLSLNHYGQPGAEELAKVLPRLKSLQQLFLYDSEITDQGAIAISNGIRPLHNLRILDMELNMYHVEGVRAIVSALEGNEHLEELYLGDRIDDECARLIATGMKSWKKLRILILGAFIGNEGAYHVSESFRFTPKIEKLLFTELVGDTEGRGMSSWTSNLKYLPRLQELNLSVNSIGPDGGIQSLVAAFPHLPQLKTLHLSFNQLWNEGINILAENLHHLPRLTTLDVSHTECGDEGAHRLALALIPMIGQIEHIQIKHNHLSNQAKTSLKWLFDDKIEV